MKRLIDSWLLLVLMGPVLRASTLVVNTVEDEPNTQTTANLSLREAIASLGSEGGTICFAPNLAGQTLVLESRLFLGTVGSRITIDGSTTGGSPPRILAGEGVTGSALMSAQNRDVRLQNLIIDGGGSFDTGVSVNGAKLELNSVEITGFANIGANVSGGEAEYADSYFHQNNEAIRLFQSSAEVNRCLIAFHRNTGATVTGLTSELVVRFRNCTFAENRALNATRGVLHFEGTEVLAILVHCSFVDNAGYAFSGPEEVLAQGNLFARNTLDAGNGEKVSVFDSGVFGVTSEGYNLSDAAAASFDDPTDVITTNANVSRLGHYGGNLMCCFPYANSQAIDGGIPDRTFPLLFRDIRGFQRLAKTSSGSSTNVMDIGAVEVNPHGTIEITDTGGSNSGSLALALQAATEETNHLVLKTPITQNTFNFITKRVLGGERNFNIDGTGASYRFTSDSANAELFEVGDGVTPGTSVSFDGVDFVDFDAETSGSERGVISVNLGCRASFHRCTFDGNTTVITGVIDSAGEVFLNESEILNSAQVLVFGEEVKGGAAIRSTNGSVTAWNSTFARNVVDRFGVNGGAIQLSSFSHAYFRRCTFSENEVSAQGSAIYAFDSANPNRSLVLEHCTFAGNEAVRGCVVFENRMQAKISACLFKGNVNFGSAADELEKQDLYAVEEESVSLELEFPNWTDSPEVSLDFVAPDQRGAVFELAPLANWGGSILTRPLIIGSQLDPEIMDRVRRSFEPRDALNEVTVDFQVRPGQSTLSIYRPGAVQRRVNADEVLTTSVSGPNSNHELVLRVGGRFGLRWRVETSTGLSDFVPTDLVVTPNVLGAQTVLVPLPTPVPERFFVRLVPEP